MCSDLVVHLGKCSVEENQVQKQDSGKEDSCPVEGQSVDSSNEMEKFKSIKVAAQTVCSVKMKNDCQETCEPGVDLEVQEPTIPKEIVEELLQEILETRAGIPKAPKNLLLLEDIEHEGVLEQVVGAKFGLVALQGGEKALLRKKRLWVEGKLPGEWQWEEVERRTLFCKVRKLSLETQVIYQVSFFTPILKQAKYFLG